MEVIYPCVFLRLVEENLEVLVTLLFMVAGFSPFCNRFSMEDENVEKGIKKKDLRRLNRGRVQKNGQAAFVFQGVRIQCRLDHDERVSSIFVVKDMSVESSLIGRIVEYLQELTSAEMEHKLRI